MTTTALRFAGRLARSRSAVFVCDIQKRFEKLIPHSDALVRTSKMVVDAAVELDVPLVVTEQNPAKLLPTVDELRKSFPPETPVFEKTSFSMITPEVQDQLSGELQAVESVILIGIETHVCVFQTAMDLLEQGYDVHVVTDACSSQKDVDRLVAFERLKQSGAFLTTAECVVFDLVRDASDPSFRKISNLVKSRAADLKDSKL